MSQLYYHGVKVSPPHFTILNGYERKYHAPAQLNQGQRNLSDQQRLFDEKGQYNAKTNPHGAAYPNADAPHIKHGADNHALDINAGSGIGEAKHVAAYYRSLGVKVSFNVPTEAWHMDPTDLQSLRLGAKKVSSPDPRLRKGSVGPSVVKLKRLLFAAGFRGFSSKPTGGAGNNRFSPYYGKYTVDCVERAQKHFKLPVTGITTDALWEKLR